MPNVISPTGLDSASQCVAKRCHEVKGAPAFNRFAAPAVALGGQIHDAVRQLAQHGKAGVAAEGQTVPTKRGPQSLATVAQRITETVKARWPAAEAWAIERPICYFADAEHSTMIRGRLDYAPFGQTERGLGCLGVVDLKSKGNLTLRFKDQLSSITMHRQLFACAIASMCPSYTEHLALEVQDDGSAHRPPGTWGRGWHNPITFAEVAEAVETAPLPEVWLLVWDKDNDRPVWRAHWISRPALRAFMRQAVKLAAEVNAALELPAADWPRSFNCDDPWECPHKMRCATDLADAEVSADQLAADAALFRLGAAPRS